MQFCDRLGITIPRFCYNNNLSVAGNCRICMVELKNSAKPVTSCTTTIMDKMNIFTDTPLVKKARENLMEFLLINHPLDCPICDQGGECDLQDLSLNFGSDKSRYFNFKRIVEDKHCGPIIKTIMTRCIHCTKCVRFLTEICDYPLYGTVGRGSSTEISTFLEKNLNNELSGNLIDLCPVGALTSKVETFMYRPWELNRVENIDFYDPTGSTVAVYTRNISFIKNQKDTFFSDSIIRILPKPNFWINMDWLTDKSRFSYKTIFKNRNFYILDKNGYKMSWYQFIQYLIIEKPLTLWNKKKQKYITNPVFQHYGLFLDSNSIIFPNFLFTLLGQNNWFVNGKMFNINTDIPYFYRTNTWFPEIEKYNVFLLLNVDLRYESPMLHLYCRKAFLHKNSIFFLIGNFFNSFFPVKHLGFSTKIFYDILEGRHKICRFLRNTENLLFFVGHNYIYKQKSKLFQRLIQFFIKKSILNIKNTSSYNLILNNTTKTTIAELGLQNATNAVTNLSLKDYNLTTNNYFNEKTNHMIFQDLEAYKKLNSNKKINRTTIYFFHTHITKYTDFLIPTKTLYEKNGFLFNTQGRIRYFRRSISSYGMNTGIDDFFRFLFFFFIGKKRKEKEFKEVFQPLFFSNYYPLLFQKFIKEMSPKLRKLKKVKQQKQVFLSQYTNSWNRGFFNVLFLSIFITNVVLVKHSSFFKLIKNFYTDNYLSANSNVLMQAFLLQKHGINFNQKNTCF